MHFALALGGGGTKGISHLGVLKALEDSGIHIGAIAGCSIGGLVGAVYASGRSIDDVVEIFSNVPQRTLFARGRGVNNALLGLDGVAAVLLELIGDLDFADLKIPLALVAVDLDTGQEIILNQGNVVDAVLATIAIPGIFPPRVIGDRVLVDGGVSNPVPVQIARELGGAKPVFASVLSNPPLPEQRLPVVNFLPPNPTLERLAQFRLAKALGVFTQAMNINSRVLTETRLAAEKPDCLIRPAVDHIGLLDPVNVQDLVDIGELAARRALAELKQSRRFGSRVWAWFRRRIPQLH
jgi:NTE family protein